MSKEIEAEKYHVYFLLHYTKEHKAMALMCFTFWPYIQSNNVLTGHMHCCRRDDHTSFYGANGSEFLERKQFLNILSWMLINVFASLIHLTLIYLFDAN